LYVYTDHLQVLILNTYIQMMPCSDLLSKCWDGISKLGHEYKYFLPHALQLFIHYHPVIQSCTTLVCTIRVTEMLNNKKLSRNIFP
jgi:hypothetical protein